MKTHSVSAAQIRSLAPARTRFTRRSPFDRHDFLGAFLAIFLFASMAALAIIGA